MVAHTNKLCIPLLPHSEINYQYPWYWYWYRVSEIDYPFFLKLLSRIPKLITGIYENNNQYCKWLWLAFLVIFFLKKYHFSITGITGYQFLKYWLSILEKPVNDHRNTSYWFQGYQLRIGKWRRYEDICLIIWIIDQIYWGYGLSIFGYQYLFQPVLNFLGFCMFIGTGTVTILTWQNMEVRLHL